MKRIVIVAVFVTEEEESRVPSLISLSHMTLTCLLSEILVALANGGPGACCL